jgi:SAM-dependent methyltransferase
MAKIYSQLARAYHELYQSIFDYEREFRFYHKILKKHRCRKVLEVGCGTGNLAPHFLKAKYVYLGVDLSPAMLKRARTVAPTARFTQGDMRKLRLKEKFDAVLVTGRSFTHMTTNENALAALRSLKSCLRSHGILVFDNFDAEVIFTAFKQRFVHTAKFGKRFYRRESRSTMQLEKGWVWRWDATWRITENSKTRTIRDSMLLHAFTEDELRILLSMAGLKLERFYKDGSSITVLARF